MSETATEVKTSAPLDLEEELGKVKDVLGALWAKINHGTEEEASSVAAMIDAIGPQPVAEEPVAAEENVSPDAPKSLSEMTDDELQAELAKRQAGSAGNGS